MSFSSTLLAMSLLVVPSSYFLTCQERGFCHLSQFGYFCCLRFRAICNLPVRAFDAYCSGVAAIRHLSLSDNEQEQCGKIYIIHGLKSCCSNVFLKTAFCTILSTCFLKRPNWGNNGSTVYNVLCKAVHRASQLVQHIHCAYWTDVYTIFINDVNQRSLHHNFDWCFDLFQLPIVEYPECNFYSFFNYVSNDPSRSDFHFSLVSPAVHFSIFNRFM